LREECRPRVFESRVLRRIFRPERDDQRRDLAPSKNELVDKYLNAFSQFVNSVDFSKL